MSKPENSIQSIVIVGGGTAGWIAAAVLGNIFKNTSVKISVVESPDIGIIGVGEATIPPFLTLIRSLGIDEKDFIQKTQSSFKWGIEFVDWMEKGQSYFHPFGVLGKEIDGHGFYHCWSKLRSIGDDTPLMAHSPEAVMSQYNRFYLPQQAPNTPISNSAYALHLDSGLVGKYLRDFSEGIGVKRIEANVIGVNQKDDGYIKNLYLEDKGELSADLYIDCTGFRGLLIEGALQAGYENWSEFLPCDRAVTVQSRKTKEVTPYTKATARKAGWTWRIPLQHRVGNGYVFASAFCDDEEATADLLAAIDGPAINQPRVIPFTTGIRKKTWDKNCLALGLAAGFLEPLESTAIHLVYKTLFYFIRLFPDLSFDERLIKKFNARVRLDYEEIRDFLILHYCETRRSDTEFWRWCQSMKVPDSLKQRIEYFKVTGDIQPEEEALFKSTSWYAVFEGMGLRPDRYNPLVDALDTNKLQSSLNQGRRSILNFAQRLPSHEEFLATSCPAPEPVIEGR